MTRARPLQLISQSDAPVRRDAGPRRGLSREEAAVYVGFGTTKFDEMVSDGRMPTPRRDGGRRVWDIRELDIAFEALPKEARPGAKPEPDGASGEVRFRA